MRNEIKGASDPEDVAKLLNEYLGLMAQRVRTWGGTREFNFLLQSDMVYIQAWPMWGIMVPKDLRLLEPLAS